MSQERDDALARRYLLGQAEESAAAAFEDAIVRDAGALDRAEAAEDALIEDYVSGRLSAHEHGWFERHYLTAPHHRVRMETVRRLMFASRARAREHSYGAWLAAAAALVIAAGIGWIYLSRVPQVAPETQTTASRSDAPARDRNLPNPAAPPVRVFATSLSPITLRSGEGAPALVIPEGTDVVTLRLNGEGARPLGDAARAVVRTVAGETVWQGEAVTDGNLPPEAVARIAVPASVLRPNDYIVELRTGPAAERELYRYVLRVRSTR
jgi:hypothetical protein